MRYHDGSEVRLGDIVSVPSPDGEKEARVVMLGDTKEHLDIDPGFVKWVLGDAILASTSIFVEWIASTPFTHSDPQFAPIGSFMSTTVDEHVHFKCRAPA
ncbi:UNVERIFIED_ORG: hypothetical protein GGR68_002865 [Xanthomonas campestris]|uniref:hypothetical protein n=1 Tax=Xanthomonas arboricola TaxID=56448 RepID=UPI0016217F97